MRPNLRPLLSASRPRSWPPSLQTSYSTARIAAESNSWADVRKDPTSGDRPYSGSARERGSEPTDQSHCYVGQRDDG